MKFFAIFAAIMALAFAKRNGIYELSEAIQNPNTDPAMIPYLEAALNELLEAAMTPPIQPAPVVEPTIDTAAIEQLIDAIHSPATDPAMLPYLEAALNELLAPITNPLQPIPVVSEPVVPTVLTSWSLQELSDAIQNPNTDPALLPHLENGLNAMMSSLIAGEQQEFIVIALPSNLAPISQEVSPVAPAPVVVPAPVEAPLEVAAPEAASSPLVQIIVNVNSQASAPEVQPIPAPVGEWVPPPRPVPSTPEVQPIPAPVVEWVPPRPVPEQSIVPVNPIVIKPPQVIVNPIDVIAVSAPEENPIDVIAVSAPEVNPIDILHPVPAAVGAAVVGPLL